MKGFRATGTITDVPGKGFFRVTTDDKQIAVLCRIAGPMERQHIRIATGDRVAIEICPADLTPGRITWRL